MCESAVENYDAAMRRTMEKTPAGSPLLLHACCAPCASVALERLAGHFAVTLYFYNPNIAPKEEYVRRRSALENLVSAFNGRGGAIKPVAFLEGAAAPDPFLAAAAGLENEPEGGARCGACFALRLSAAAQKAAELGISLFGTTLSTGPRKSAAALYAAGAAAAEACGLSFLPSDFKKKNGYARSIELCAQYSLYRQNYCGCAFSFR